MVNNVDTVETQMVLFTIADKYYGVDISSVREIIRMQTVTRLPGSVSFLEGVTNLRGALIPVLDLRKRFKLDKAEHGKDAHIMVVQSNGQDIGMIVDSVAGVSCIPSDAVEPSPRAAMRADSVYLLGTARLPDKLVVLIDTNGLITRDDISAVSCLS